MAVKVKKYDPNEYNFGNFADAMNKNFAIERTQNLGGAAAPAPAASLANPVNLGGKTNSQTLGNLPQIEQNAGGTFPSTKIGKGGIYRDITTRYKDMLGKINLGEQASYTSPFAGKNSPTAGDGTADVESGVVESGEGTSIPYEEPNESNNDLGEKADAMMQALGNFSRSKEDRTGYYNVNSKNIEEIRQYLSNLGYHSRDINLLLSDSKYKIEIAKEMSKTVGDDDASPAKHARNSNYFGQSMLTSDFNNEVNDTLESGKLDFATWQSTYSVDPAEKYKAAQAQLDYEFKTWMSTYGARAEQLYQMGLSNSGVSDIYGANAYSAYIQASLDLKRAQIEQEQENKALYAQYSAEYDAQQTSMTSAAFNAYASTYTPDQEQSIRVALEAQGLTAEQVENAITQLNNYYNSLPEDQRPDVAAENAKVDEAFKSLAASYATDNSTDKDQRIRDMYASMGWSQSEIDKLINMLNGFAGVNGNQVDSTTIINDAAVRLATTLFTNEETGASTYTGSEAQKNQIRQLMQRAEYKDVAPYVEQIIAKMDENLAVQTDAEVSDIVSNYEKIATDKSWLSNPSTSTMANYISGIEQYKQQYGVNSKEYKDALAAGSASIKDYILAATDSESMLDDAGAWLGVDFAEMDTADKFNAVLEGAGELHRDGYMTDEDYESIINTWLNGQVLNAETSDNPFFDLSQKLERLTEYYENYNLNPRVYDGMRRKITKNIGINDVKIANASGTKVTKVYISCSVNGKALRVEATYSGVNKDDKEYVSYLAEKNGHDSLFAWGDNIYYADNSGKVFVLTSFSFFGAANAGSGPEVNRAKKQLLLAAVNSQTK